MDDPVLRRRAVLVFLSPDQWLRVNFRLHRMNPANLSSLRSLCLLVTLDPVAHDDEFRARTRHRFNLARLDQDRLLRHCLARHLRWRPLGQVAGTRRLLLDLELLDRKLVQRKRDGLLIHHVRHAVV